jgi:hypothetical protein
MAIPVTDLAPGDRVILNCPKARIPKRQAQFQGLYNSTLEMIDAAFPADGDRLAIFADPIPPDEGQEWAAFLFWASDSQEMRGAFAVQPDGNLLDEEGRKIYVEQRLGRANQG